MAAENNHYETCEVLLRAGISKDSRTKVDRYGIKNLKKNIYFKWSLNRILSIGHHCI